MKHFFSLFVLLLLFSSFIYCSTNGFDWTDTKNIGTCFPTKKSKFLIEREYGRYQSLKDLFLQEAISTEQFNQELANLRTRIGSTILTEIATKEQLDSFFSYVISEDFQAPSTLDNILRVISVCDLVIFLSVIFFLVSLAYILNTKFKLFAEPMARQRLPFFCFLSSISTILTFTVPSLFPQKLHIWIFLLGFAILVSVYSIMIEKVPMFLRLPIFIKPLPIIAILTFSVFKFNSNLLGFIEVSLFWLILLGCIKPLLKGSTEINDLNIICTSFFPLTTYICFNLDLFSLQPANISRIMFHFGVVGIAGYAIVAIKLIIISANSVRLMLFFKDATSHNFKLIMLNTAKILVVSISFYYILPITPQKLFSTFFINLLIPLILLFRIPNLN
ncbi:hypothetical protein M0813_01379 [Anaeramoeba flamelloides]|uniref:Uncharacterized protein n=1 Tax=Anaeramoeba flamelloides TaxID=1746091 RepID=A0ABQ8Z980_9EUKA|nr:hypothetical protein M0813_01379 [Anaeramoeba flamelloides]